ncbi:MAG: hypothetical protein P9M14_14410, partial [Candidatus Alcyoniella australis]|nr:hypothetical protein [Candidatus Alcyoniella australis]
GATSGTNAEILIKVNGEIVHTLAITPQDADVMRLIDLEQYTSEGNNEISIELQGEGSLLYSIVSRFWLPWKQLPATQGEPMNIDVRYDKTELTADDIVTCNVRVNNNLPGELGMVIVDLGVPPGFEVLTEDLDELVGSKVISRYELTGRQVIVYLDELNHERPVELSYRLRAKYPLKAQTPRSRVYQYYDPTTQALARPTTITVNQ